MPPLIEILPHTSTTSTAPGWAYVLDTGPLLDPSKASVLQPAGPRHRTARAAGGEAARQSAAVVKRLAELEKDGHRELQVQVPVGSGRGREVGRITKTKLTPNVRRILLSQKTFANHLADEEALLATTSTTTATTPAAASSTTNPSTTTRPSRTTTTKPSAPPLSKNNTSKKRSLTTKPAPTPTPTTSTATTTTTTSSPPLHPLLASSTPPPPSPSTITSLLSTPPLSYTAARAAPPAGANNSNSAPPARHFCEICGYWGRVRCPKCGARVCGLECKGVHDEGRCLRFYA